LGSLGIENRKPKFFLFLFFEAGNNYQKKFILFFKIFFGAFAQIADCVHRGGERGVHGRGRRE
jgi:hypothetical protein